MDVENLKKDFYSILDMNYTVPFVFDDDVHILRYVSVGDDDDDVDVENECVH
jgi:hypothetical protein